MSAPAPQYQFSIRDTINAIVDEYARRHKPAAGQLGLFEKPEERQKPLFSKSVDDEAGRWVTMRGTRVYISNDDGRIMKGPKKLIGKTKEQIEKESAEEGGPAPKPKGLAELGRISGGRADNRQKRLFEELNPGFKFEDDEEEDFKTVEPVAMAEVPFSPADESESSYEEQVLQGIQEKLKAGEPVMLVTNTKAIQFDERHTDMFRVKNGSLQVQRGKNWDTIAFGPLDHLAAQVGVNRPESDDENPDYEPAAEENILSADFVNDYFNGDAGAAIEAMELNRSREIKRANELGANWDVDEIDSDWMKEVSASAEESGAGDEEPQFTLDSTPAPSPAKPVDFGNPDPATVQGALFDIGKNDLPGQELLFNSDAGDLNNPKTMENRTRVSPRGPYEWKENKSGKKAWFKGDAQITGAFVDDSWADEAARQLPADADEMPAPEHDFKTHPEFNRLQSVYGHLSNDEIESKIDKMTAEIASLQNAGRREFNMNGGRRTSAAVSAEGARNVGQEKLLLGAYLKHRQKNQEDGPNEGDRDAVGLVFRDGRWHRDDEEQAESAPSSPAVNPFREKMDSLNRKADSLTPGGSAFDKAMASSFPVGVGRSGNASSRRTSKQAAKRIDQSVNNALKSIEVRKQANSLSGQTEAFDRGEIDQHGNRTELGKQRDAEQLAKSQERKQTVQNFWDNHADFMKATLKPGDSLALAANPSNTITVKRVNKTGVTSEGGSKWVYADLIPLKDGKPMESREVISAVNEWKKGQETPKVEESPNDGDTNAEGLVFRNGRWHRDEEDERPAPEASSSPADPDETTKQQVKKLLEIKEENYRLSGDANPKVAAAYAVDGIMNMYRGQPQHLEQLLNEEIEDAMKAQNKLKPAEPEQQSEPEPQPEPEPPKSTSDFSGSFDPEKHGDYRSLIQLSQKIDSGELLFEEFQQAHKFYADNKEAFVADLQKRYDAKQLRNMAANLGDWQAIRGENKKNENAESVYAAMMQRAFNVGDGISNTYSYEDIKGEGGMTGAAVRRLAAHVAKQTPESLAAHVEKEAKNVADRAAAEKANEEAAANPKTLKDFELAIKKAGSYEKLTPEQQETYDNLMSEKTRSGREEVKKPAVVEAKVSGDHGGFELTKNFHSKRGQDIFTASPKNRVDRDEYDKMNTAAKRLGGWYYKQFGGTPGGFHFPDEDKRNRFLQAMAGEKVDRSDILGEKQEEREKTVGEKLADHAERLEERASASYSAERKENTNKRAGQAASARASAEHDLNQAVRLRSISEAMSNGEVKHLRGLSALTQLESLQRIWKQAQRKHEEQKLKDKYGDDWSKNATYQERENTYQASVSADSAAFAKMPRQIIYPSNVGKFLDAAANTPGLKQEATKWKKLLNSQADPEDRGITLNKQSTKDWFDFANRAKSKGVKHDWSGFSSKDDFQRLYAMGIQEDHELRAALRELAPHQAKRHGSVQKDPVKELEKKIHREHREQGFYPTPPRVIDRMMDHADIRDGQSVLEPSAGSGRIMDAVKAAHGDSVTLKGIEHHSALQDLLKMKGHEVEHDDFLKHTGEYDRIVMNPPFENDQAIDHVKHAFSLLKPGGKLVAVVPGGDRLYREAGRNKRKEFADFVDEHGEFEELPESSFAGSDAPRQTGVNTSLVILKKPDAPGAEKYSRLHIYETMNGVIDRYVRPESEVVPVDKYAHPLIHAAVGAGAIALANKAFRSGPLRSVAHAAIGAAMAAWMQSAMAANGIQPAQAPSSPAANVATVSPPASQFQKQQMGNAAVNQIVQNAINQNAAKAQAAANAPPSPAQVSAHSISAAAAGKAGVPGVRPLTGANAAGIPGRVQVVNPGQSQTAGKEGATAGKLPVTEPAGGSGSFNADHPRHPAGASEGRGGEFAPKGEEESGSSAPESSSSSAVGDSSNETPSPRNYPDNLNKPASEQTDYSPPERSIEPTESAPSFPKIDKPIHTGERQSRKAAWEQHLQGMAQQVTEKKEAAKAEKQQAKELAKATSFNPAELETPMADDVEPVGEAPKEEDFDSAKDYENALEKHNRAKGAKQATIKKRANADLIPEIAGQYDLNHDDLRAAVDDEIQMLLPYHNRKEEARQYISKMGWNARRINQAEDRGIDSSSTKFDDVASQWAGMFPEIAGSDESEWVARMWDLSKEGAQDPPSVSDEELVNRVAKRLAESGASFSPADDEGFEYADPGPVSGQPGDVDYTPFHRKAVVDLIVDRYMRLAGIA